MGEAAADAGLDALAARRAGRWRSWPRGRIAGARATMLAVLDAAASRVAAGDLADVRADSVHLRARGRRRLPRHRRRGGPGGRVARARRRRAPRPGAARPRPVPAPAPPGADGRRRRPPRAGGASVRRRMTVEYFEQLYARDEDPVGPRHQRVRAAQVRRHLGGRRRPGADRAGARGRLLDRRPDRPAGAAVPRAAGGRTARPRRWRGPGRGWTGRRASGSSDAACPTRRPRGRST